ncbi:MAG: hypothetical protein WCL37_01165 [Chrysiogenales bacterium]
MPTKRTTMRSSKGTKLYAVRDSDGRFKDIQSYKKAHSMDIKRKSKAEIAKATKVKAKAKTVKIKAKAVKPKVKAVSQLKKAVKAKKKK